MSDKRKIKLDNINLRWIFWLPAGMAGIFVAVVLAGLVVVSGRILERLAPVELHLQHIDRLHTISMHMEEVLVQGLRGEVTITSGQLESLRDDLHVAEKEARHSHPDTLARLRDLQGMLVSGNRQPLETLVEALATLRGILNNERQTHNQLVDAVARDTRLELNLAIMLMIAFPAITALAFFIVNQRIKNPLDELSSLLRRLAAQDYRPVEPRILEQTSTLFRPVFQSYNSLVNRLGELESEHRALQLSLQADIREATGALLEQARDLARAEKLAAVGELSAAMAHEIRNPLAGIQLACTKLGRELSPEQQRRIDTVVSELKRLNGLLSERVNEARHSPENLTRVDVAELVTALVSLVRYQVPERVKMHDEVTGELVCKLPESGLRQSLINLVLNAAHAIGEDGGNITVFAQRSGDHLDIGVWDDGPGFPQYILDSGVRPFVTGRTDGTGLGLAIVQRFARSISGELLLANRSGGGARVTIRLPYLSRPEK